MNKNQLIYEIMKPIRMMLSASAAVLALVSCNKQDVTPEVAETYPKTVEIKVNNLFMTKSAGELLEEGQIALNTMRLYLVASDGTIKNTARDASGVELEEKDYAFTSVSGDPVTYHFVDPSVNKVVALANLTESQFASITDYASIKALALDLQTQQDEANLALIAESALEPAGEQHLPSNNDDHNNEITNVYTANLTLAPTVARLELDGFAVKYYADASKQKFNKITINQVAFNNYYPTANLYTGATSGTLVDCNPETVASAVEYLTTNAGLTVPSWYFDKFSTPVEIERPSGLTEDTYVEAEIGYACYYHTFAGTYAVGDAGYPELMFQLVAEDLEGVESSTYIYTKSLMGTNGTAVTEFEPGKIYRMSFTINNNDDNGSGDVPIDEDDIEQLGRCLDITVTVKNWSLVLVTPEF